ncbi:hypothetical protein HY407_03565 [Candidatus Gottesmanbacteria bacterium]|nr:hypothetical protein [Candidatus Gottesmanbacteria bacterium]
MDLNKESLIVSIKNYQGFIITALIAITMVWLVNSYLIPNIQKTQQTLATQKDLDSREKMLSTKLEVLESINKDVELEALKKIIAVLPEEKDAFSIFNGLDTQEKDAAVVVTQSDFRVGIVSTDSASINKELLSNKKYQGIDIKFTILGDREQLLTLLANLQNFKTRLFAVKDMTVKLGDGTAVEASFTLTTYYQPFPNDLGQVDSILPQLTAKQVEIKDQIVQMAILPSTTDESIPTGKTNLFQ